VKLFDAPRCPYCARVRITLAEKGISYEAVEIDLKNRPRWLYELNASGRVPVLDDAFVLPESEVIMGYLDERYPAPPLQPADPVGRARTRLLVHRFDENLGECTDPRASTPAGPAEKTAIRMAVFAPDSRLDR